MHLLAIENFIQNKTRSHGANSIEHNSLSNIGVGNAILQPFSCFQLILGAIVKNEDWGTCGGCKSLLVWRLDGIFTFNLAW